MSSTVCRRRLGRVFLGLVLAVSCVAASPAADAPIAADVLLKGGTIYEGSGAAATVGDVALRDGKIAAVGKCAVAPATRVIDCAKLVVAPGFIDLHTHCNPVGSTEIRRNLNYLTQGCTTVVTGSCGGGAFDVAAYFQKIDQQGSGTNVIHLVPHGAVRQKAMGGDNRAPTDEELQRMQELVDRGMRDGACGMSTRLIYAPGMFAKTDELIALTKVVARHGGLYVSHIRGEGSGLIGSVQEALKIGRAAGAPVHISHLKAATQSPKGLLRAAAKLIEEARAGGLTVTADQYPYTASSTSITATLFPATEIPGGLKDFARRIQSDPDFERSVRQIVQRRLGDRPRIVLASCKHHPQWVGKDLADIAAELKVDLPAAAIRIQVDGGASVVRFAMSEEDVRFGMTRPWVATGSDGGSQVPNPASRPHQRSFGTFPRKIGLYAQKEHVLPLAQAIRSATGLPADILKLTNRGYLRPGYIADIVVFDPATFIDRATFEQPQQYAAGVRWLIIAGKAAIDDGKPSKQFYGRPIHYPGR